ncbi:MAG: 4-hydroxy-3-methylbut-2-enyl diphosphate reductase [Alphaproteobacteria bacterium CG11_big_fil_rev_8_21_14_0_20_44_7]|nr:MAG: 4-hydroxy-3-methylbut-2-enyl diphosphate reductase [Alphaproteobacteria bacterium CG11_big_fil_rev_8_21_14_0_20_44_7]
MKVILANPRGFCAGVDRAIEIVEKALAKYGAPVFVRHEIVHNKFVVDDLKAKGAVFVDEISEIPDGGITVFSAHGVSEKVENSAKLRELPVIDATCPLVTKVHNEARRYEADGREIILIGHKGHPEVEGTSGRVQKVHLVETIADVENLQIADENNLAYVTQTTLSLDDTKFIIDGLKARFPNIEGPDTRDICYATQNRQNAVRELAGQVDVLLVIGAANSSNSNRLRDLGEELGVASYLIDGAAAIDKSWLSNKIVIGVTAGASAPEVLVQNVINRLREFGANEVQEFDGKRENIKFKLPEELKDEVA